MNRHWGIRLGDVAGFVRGITYKPGDVMQGQDVGSIPCMRTKNIQEFLEDDDLVFIPERLAKPDRRLIEGDILVSSANSWNLVGKCCWVPSLGYEATFGGFTSVLRANRKIVDPRFLYRWFSWDKTQALVRSFGQQTTNISNLNQSRCLELSLSLPPLDEQRRIAAILDKADALRQKRKRAIALLDALTQSIFIEIFGDPIANASGLKALPLRELVDRKRDISYGVVQRGPDQDEGVPVVRISDFGSGRLTLSELKRTTQDISAKYPRTVLQGGEILISIRGTVGRCAVVPAAAAGANVSREVAVIPTVNKALNHFYLALLKSAPVQKAITDDVKGVAQSGINLEDLRQLPVIQPTASDLQRFSRASEMLLMIAERSRDATANSDAAFISLQHRAFSGQL